MTKLKLTSAQRAANRDAAWRALPQVEKAAYRVKVRDDFGHHVTVWLTPTHRVEWWPGSMRWSGINATSAAHAGDPAALLAWLKTKPHEEDDPVLIEEDDA